MKIQRTSMFSQKFYEWDLPITEGQWHEYSHQGKLIQEAFPHLTKEQREFIMTGVTPDEWNAEFRPKTWQEMAERLEPGNVIRMLVDLGLGLVLGKGRTFIVEENNLNEMQACVSVVAADKEWAIVPGPQHPDGPDWEKIATFEVLYPDQDEALGITEVD